MLAYLSIRCLVAQTREWKTSTAAAEAITTVNETDAIE